MNRNFENGLQHTDVTIDLVDGEIKVHKFVLSSRPAYFTAMFQEDKFIEAGGKVVFPYSRCIMNTILQWFYGGELDLNQLTLEDSAYFLDCARLLLLDEVFESQLSKIMVRINRKDYSVDNCKSGLDLSIRLKIDLLTVSLGTFIAQNMDEFMRDGNFDIFSLSSEAFMAIAMSGIRKVWSDLSRIKFIRRWLVGREMIPSTLRQEIANSFCLKAFSVTELESDVWDSELFKHREILNAIGSKYKQLKGQNEKVLMENSLLHLRLVESADKASKNYKSMIELKKFSYGLLDELNSVQLQMLEQNSTKIKFPKLF